ncbi:MAG TPA: cellulase family glycosylhydrolase, partial [Candidatus Solibacter sp.]|nr:cellulase family glycosylhydrolase [Candidatus Solibacter sp.]
MALRVLSSVLLSFPLFASQQQITPKPSGPFHVSGNRILDSRNQPFLMRGTQLTDFHPQNAARDNRGGRDFGPHSSTSLSAIRLRFNMNTVRIPLDAREAARPGYFATLARTVRRANEADLLVVLAARDATPEFWAQCASYFKDYPNVMFDLLADAQSDEGWDAWRARMNELTRTVRAAGARQPVIAMSWNAAHDFAGIAPLRRYLLEDPNTIYEIVPTYPAGDRHSDYGELAALAPVTAAGWDIAIADASACAKLPTDPAAVTAMIRANLEDFDARGISWTASVYEAGKLIKDYS